MLEIRDLHVRFHGSDHEAVRGIGLSVADGEIVGLVGESGSGKTVTAMTVSGLLDHRKADVRGSICLDGRQLLDLGGEKLRSIQGKDICVVFQEPMSALDPAMRIGPQVEECLRAHTALSREERRECALEALREVDLPDAEGIYRKYPHELSGGMLQRVCIAAAILPQPKLLLADEPTTALDVTIQAQILKLMNELKEQTGASILFITHDLGVIHEMADEVAVMYCGQIVEKASAKTIFHNGVYSHPYTEALMTSIPRLNTPKGQRLEAIPGAVPNPLYLPQGCKFAPRCKYCTQKCMEAEPPLQEVAPNHLVRCFYAEKAGRKDNVE